MNRPIIVIIGAHIPPVLNHQRLFLYFLRIMDPIVVSDYVRIFLKSGGDSNFL
jgi:hypothetical protein